MMMPLTLLLNTAKLSLATTVGVLFLGWSQSTLAQQKLVTNQSSIVFTSKQMGVPVDGKFAKFDAQISFNPKDPSVSKIGFTVDTASATIGDADTMKELRKPEWFDMVKFPTATFQSSTAKALGGGRFEVAGNLVIKGKTNPITAVVQLAQKGDITTVEGNFPIKRLDFTIGDGDWKDVSIVANEVIVKLKLSLTGIPPL
jgi:polyisoprenoid-binding protein YceI